MVEDLKNNIIDIDIQGTKKKRFRLDQDNARIIELDTSDLNILSRFAEAIEAMEKVQDERGELEIRVSEEITTAEMKRITKSIKDIEQKMVEQVNYIFDFDVCTPACGNASLFDPINGMFRYEHIINRLIALYEENLKVEAKKMQARISKHTQKYKKGR